jgi:dTDP-glucose 4,6-dehydratase
MILQEMWKDESYISYVTDRAGHDIRYAIDASKIQTDLNWYPKIQFELWIKITLDYYKNN